MKISPQPQGRRVPLGKSGSCPGPRPPGGLVVLLLLFFFFNNSNKSLVIAHACDWNVMFLSVFLICWVSYCQLPELPQERALISLCVSQRMREGGAPAPVCVCAVWTHTHTHTGARTKLYREPLQSRGLPSPVYGEITICLQFHR